MKKSKYISKYDYISYYTKPKSYWFYTNAEIESALQTIYRNLSKNKKDIYDDWDEDETSQEDDEKDSYQFYLETKEELKNIDLNNPKIAEGIIIDQESKKFIKEKYITSLDTKIIDFDESAYKFKTMEEIAEMTKDIILTNKNLIMFQAVFIHNNTITKPDAFIKKDNDITIIETKGTSTCKKHHFLDLFFQKNVIESQQYLIDMNCIFDYKLCLVKYEYLNKYEVSFVVTDFINYTKTYSDNEALKQSPYKHELRSFAKVGYHIVKDSTPNDPHGSCGCPIKINNLIKNNLIDFEERIETSLTSQKNKILSAQNDFITVLNEYDSVIETLWNHKCSMKETDYITKIQPDKNSKNVFKNFDYFVEERKIFSLMGYNRFEYSGNVAYQNKDNVEKAKINEQHSEFIKTAKDAQYSFHEMFTSGSKLLIDEIKATKQIEHLKEKKVYFDFETINTAIRSLDKSLPFQQVVTQCSIIKDLNNNIDNVGCNNMIIDPKNINDDWLKSIVDNIYAGKEIIFSKKENDYYLPDDNDDISYIVYNKSFECSRLREIKDKLKLKDYSLKVDHIISNIYDIANFFSISSKKGYLLFFEELKGFYSIKKVLPLISKYAPNIFNKTNCLNYSDLEISNGKICQEKTIQRFFNKVSDDEWKSIEDKLKIYCENDVRAMIAVEYFVKDIINQKIKI